MAKYIVEGGQKLNGEVKISGNKNSIFPCVSACLLTDQEVILKNIPKIVDTDVLVEILRELGVEVFWEDHVIKITAGKINTHELPNDLTVKLRGSVVLVGGLLGRLGKAKFCHPGGDVIGKRSIETHTDGFRGLGYEVNNEGLEYEIDGQNREKVDRKIYLEEPSVTATENLILASVIGGNEVVLKNCAKEPHIVDLCTMLNQMGAKISGLGQSNLTITQVPKLNGTEFSIGPDFVEFGSYTIAAAITHGQIKITNCNLTDLEPVILPLKRMGVEIEEITPTSVIISAVSLKSIEKLHTNIWPGFPTDLMSVAIVLATQAEGISLLHDWMYESRMFFVDKLIAMGANITIADPHRVVIYGPTKLKGRNQETPDIRAGMALVLASLVASGKSTINRAELIERGYEDVVGKLSSLGAKIERVE